MNYIKKRYLVIMFTLLSVIFAAGCAQQENNAQPAGNSEGENAANNKDERLTVYTSFYPLYDFASKIAGDQAEVINLVPPGAAPHDFEPTPQDIVQLSESNLFIYNGSGFELWIDDVLGSIDTSNMTILNTSEVVPLLSPNETGLNQFAGEEEEAGNEAMDPHIWLDPVRMKEVAAAIKDALVSLDPSGKETFEQNYSSLVAELDKLNAEYETAIKNADRKDVVVSHDAYGYLMNRYGLNQVPITGLSPSDEPSQKELQEIIAFVKEKDIQYILFETLVTVKIAEVIKEEVGAEALTLNPLEGLTEEELAAGKDYFSVMRENLESLKIALGSE